MTRDFGNHGSMFVSVQVFFSMLASVEGHFHLFSHHRSLFKSHDLAVQKFKAIGLNRKSASWKMRSILQKPTTHFIPQGWGWANPMKKWLLCTRAGQIETLGFLHLDLSADMTTLTVQREKDAYGQFHVVFLSTAKWLQTSDCKTSCWTHIQQNNRQRLFYIYGHVNVKAIGNSSPHSRGSWGLKWYSPSITTKLWHI